MTAARENGPAGAAARPRAELVFRDAAQLVRCAGAMYDADVVAGGWLAAAGETVLAAGTRAEVEAACDCSAAEVVDCAGKVVAPGYVDSHTHLVFAGSRVDEYAAKMAEPDAEKVRELLAARGLAVGPMETVTRTREATVERLYAESAARLAGMLAAGTTTVESKSGYGLATHTELDLLRVNRMLDEGSPVDVVSTFLGAHGFAPEVARERYIDIVCEEMTPLVADEGLATFCDVWTDDGYYDKEESRRVLEAGRAHGMGPKIHADAYSYVGGTDLAAEMGMVSADHLNFTPPEVMRKMTEAGVVGVIMPALDFAVRHPRPFDARALIDAGMTLALATDICPGCWAESQQFVMALACRLYAMSPAEAIWAATAGGAAALAFGDRGCLAPGKLADIQVWDVPQYEHAIYRLGGSVVERVYKRGRPVVERGRALTT